MIADRDLRSLVCIFDDEHVLAAVIGVVLARIDDHRDAVALIDADIVDRKAAGHFDIPAGGEVLLTEHLAVLHEQDRHAVRPRRVGIFIFELGIFKVDVDPAGLRCHPLDVSRFAVLARDDVVLFDLDAIVRDVLLAVLTSLDVDGKEGIPVIAVLIIPAVVALGAEIIERRGKVDALAAVSCGDSSLSLANEAAEAHDREFILAAVVRVVVAAVDDHGQIVTLADINRGDIEALGHLGVDLRRERLLRQKRSVVVDAHPRAVRPRGIGILILHLCVGSRYADNAVLGDSPLDDR